MRSRTLSLALLASLVCVGVACSMPPTTAPPDRLAVSAAPPLAIVTTVPAVAASVAAATPAAPVPLDPNCLDCNPWIPPRGGFPVDSTPPGGGGGYWCESSHTWVDDANACPGVELRE